MKLISPSSPGEVTRFQSARDVLPSDDHVQFTSLMDLLDELKLAQPAPREEKTEAPFFTHGRCDGRRLWKHTSAPYLVILDIDKDPLAPEVLSKRLQLFGVGHVWHYTWSHGLEKSLHRYRVFTDIMVEDRWELESVTRQVLELAGAQITPESWNTLGFFGPSVCAERAALYRFGIHARPTTWSARVEKEPERQVVPPSSGGEVQDVDIAQLRAQLAAIPNDEYHQWIEIGQALHWTGHPEALWLWTEWSAGQGYGDPDPELYEEKWEGFGRNSQGRQRTLGTIWHHALEGGWKPPKTSAQDDFADEIAESCATAAVGPARAPEDRMSWLRHLNQRYAYVAIGQGLIADMTGRPHNAMSFKSQRAWLGLYKNPTFSLGRTVGKKGEEREVMEPIGVTWLEHWDGRRSFHESDFQPPGGPAWMALGDEVLNTWRGWRFEPAPDGAAGSCDLFLTHILENLCCGDELLYRWILAWLAHLVQRPWEKPGTALVLRSGEGTGKGIFGSALVHLCGAHGKHLTQGSHLTRNFNAHLEGAVFVFADEVTWGGRKQEEGALKALVTEDIKQVERKGVDAFQGRDYSRLCIASNEDWTIPAGPTARRWLILNVSMAHMEDKAYFGAIKDQLANGGYEALMRMLTDLDLSSGEYPDPMQIISTKALEEQKVQSLDLQAKWLLQILMDGRVHEMAEEWPRGWVQKSVLYDSYLRITKATGANHRGIETQVMTFMKKVFRSSVQTGRKVIGEVRAPVVRLPPLQIAREKFDAWMGSSLDWGEGESGETPESGSEGSEGV